MTPGTPEGIRRMRVVVPDHAVYRTFPNETVALNLQTGKYHGLNVVAGDMLETMRSADTVEAAIGRIADEYGQPLELIETEVLSLCELLAARGLLTFESPTNL